MIVDKAWKMAKAAAKHAGRYAMDKILLEPHGDGARIVATNGRIAVAQPVEIQEEDVLDGPKLVAAKDFTEAAKLTRFTVNGSLCLPDGRSMPLHEGDFPKVDAAVFDRDRSHSMVVRIDAKQLADLAAALGETQLILHFGGPKDVVYVKPVTGNGEAAIMPFKAS